MKETKNYFQSFMAALFGVLLFSNQLIAAGPSFGMPSTSTQNNPLGSIYMAPTQELDSNETQAILLMREEEKLARDVYITLRDKWGLIIFDDIAYSEQRHMDMVKQLIDKYGLEDPVADDSVGAFTQPEFKDLFDKLVALGEESVIEALRVGATIEDLDIFDLEEHIAKTDNDDVKQVFGNLKNGSYNHMRSFVEALRAYGDTYSAQYISEQELEDILSSAKGQGYAHTGSTYTMLPGTMKTYSHQERSAFTLKPTMMISQAHQGDTADLYALIYSHEFNKWFQVISPNSLKEWAPGMELVPFTKTIINGDTMEFPIFTAPVDVSGLTGTFDIYIGYRAQNGNLVYTFDRLIFD